MQNFPQSTWQKINNQVMPHHLSSWIAHTGSFMERLKQQGAVHPQVRVLQQSWQYPHPAEKTLLAVPPRSYALIREVLITSGEKKWMLARAVFPRATLTGQQQQLARLKNRSLGSVLFKDPNLQRSPFEVMCLQSDMSWHADISRRAQVTANYFWARRSLFVLQNKPLLLTEIFLPDVETL